MVVGHEDLGVLPHSEVSDQMFRSDFSNVKDEWQFPSISSPWCWMFFSVCADNIVEFVFEAVHFLHCI